MRAMRRGMTAVAVAGVLLAGCQNLPIQLPERGGGDDGPETSAEPTPPRPLAPELLALYARSAELDAEILRIRAEALEPRASAPGCSEARLRSAILRLHLPPAEAGDLERRLAPCRNEGVEAERAHLAALLADLLASRQEAAETTAALRERLAESENRAETLAEENARLEEQLEGLKAIERSIQERDRSQGE